ncbi:GNAT family N-acetyltransferase [Bacillus sp. 31A1R]|uniref:GNAT family N-acetyltransferase n=1 Tax=Robertmurraya mangrovi TaxID=3098077 RepID=A0ABU5IW25_9BACI|nr:GNAT family N-acetyltransferase [Bacillus sp. 31A1R]MDZ5471336.1 GNAT family N-acetyltransferase [Bacillus sp. 31A1R]
MSKLKIEKISSSNWEEAIKISVNESQKDFVPTVIESIAYAYLKPWDEALDPYVLINEDNIAIGSFYLTYTPDSEKNYWIGGFQIDRNYQGQGYGKKSLHTIIEFIKEKHPKCKIISLTVEPENIHATRLYESVGFVSQNSSNQYNESIYRLLLS